MKKQLFFIVLAGLFTSLASAADLYVRDFGAGGAYPTIGAAISAAANGDRIIIKPKAGGVPYLEDLVIDKSLTFVSENNFAKYILQGSISITPLAGRVVTINNVSLTNNIILTGTTTGGRTTVNIFNSFMNGINAQQPNATLNMSGCIITTLVSLTHGRLTGNRCLQFDISGTVADPNPSTTDIEIIANVITSTGAGIIMDQKNYTFKILNNYMTSGALSIDGIKNASNNEIRNNVINNGSSSAIVISLSTGNNGLISVLNNVLTTNSTLPSYAEIQNNGASLASVYAFYNMSTSAFTTIGVTSSSNNTGNASISINTGNFTVTGSNSNAGYPEDEYADLDLSRNDIGNYGGSDSWSNYWPAVSNKPQVNYLNTPRRIYNGTTTFNATGSGYSK